MPDASRLSEVSEGSRPVAGFASSLAHFLSHKHTCQQAHAQVLPSSLSKAALSAQIALVPAWLPALDVLPSKALAWRHVALDPSPVKVGHKVGQEDHTTDQVLLAGAGTTRQHTLWRRYSQQM